MKLVDARPLANPSPGDGLVTGAYLGRSLILAGALLLLTGPGLQADESVKEHVHEQVGRKDDHLFVDEQGHLLVRVAYAWIIQNDEEDNHPDQVNNCQVQCGKTSKFLQSFHFFSFFE